MSAEIAGSADIPMPIINLGISSEQDVVLVRQRARQISAALGFGAQDQVRIATAISELSRTAFAYVSGGSVEFAVDHVKMPPVLFIKIKSTGGAFRNMAVVTAGGQLPGDGLDAALLSAYRLMDSCTVNDETDRATVITLSKSLPANATVTVNTLAALVRKIPVSPVLNTYAEVELQNRELLATLAELRTKQDDLLSLTKELEDTNRGVVALYAEIEEKAERLRQADEMKSRFLSNTSHELRTPLSSIRALSRLLLDGIDGELTAGQEKQVRFIEQAAKDLSELVNDLLDLAKIEAGKVDVQRTTFAVSDLFSALRGMLRPLVTDAEVELVFETPIDELTIHSDEGKVSQILRNFISNALKFTEKGEVSVTADYQPSTQRIFIAVKDSGIGIAPANQHFVFEEFSQIESPLQRRSKGTGLGLPLCRKLAQLLGGEVTLASEAGAGATFSLILPAPQISKKSDDESPPR